MLHAPVLSQDSAGLRFEDLVKKLKHSRRSQQLGNRRRIPEVREERGDLGLLRFHRAGIFQDVFHDVGRKVEAHRGPQLQSLDKLMALSSSQLHQGETGPDCARTHQSWNPSCFQNRERA